MPSTPPVALLVHGAGSTPDAVRRLLGPAAAGADVVALDARGTLDDVVGAVTAAVDTAERSGRSIEVVGGISLGAHVVARWAAARTGPSPDLVLAMPAWTGAPDAIASLTASSADEVEHEGTAAILDRLLAESPDDWVVDELVRAWAGRDPVELARSLRSAALSPAPDVAELALVRARTVVVALAEDPLHPARVAEQWAAAIPGAHLVVLPRDAPGADRGALGAAARGALDA